LKILKLNLDYFKVVDQKRPKYITYYIPDLSKSRGSPTGGQIEEKMIFKNLIYKERHHLGVAKICIF
jgi:hypothetical protein